jgi:hypothetical protein
MPTKQARRREALYNPITIKELQNATGNTVRHDFLGIFGWLALNEASLH